MSFIMAFSYFCRVCLVHMHALLMLYFPLTLLLLHFLSNLVPILLSCLFIFIYRIQINELHWGHIKENVWGFVLEARYLTSVTQMKRCLSSYQPLTASRYSGGIRTTWFSHFSRQVVDCVNSRAQGTCYTWRSAFQSTLPLFVGLNPFWSWRSFWFSGIVLSLGGVTQMFHLFLDLQQSLILSTLTSYEYLKLPLHNKASLVIVNICGNSWP